MTLITEPVQRQVLALEARERALLRRTKWLLTAAAGLGATTVGAYLLTRIVGPNASPSRIDVPAKLTALFNATAPDGLPFDPAMAELTNFLSSAQPLLAGMAIVSCMVLGLRAALVGRIGNVGGVSLLGLFVLGTVLIPGVLATTEEGPRASFTRAVDDHRFEAVADDLKAIDQGSTPAGLYVLAQMSIAEGKNRMQPNANLVRELLSPTAGFTPRGEALYAIELAAYGAPRSPTAVAYLERQLARKRWTEVAAAVLGCLTVVVGGAALGQLGLRLAIGRRMRRIRALLGQGGSS